MLPFGPASVAVPPTGLLSLEGSKSLGLSFQND